MQAEVGCFLRRERMLPPAAPLWVAVSGGVDSMVLLHVLRDLGHPCSVAHVDHGLRGAESDGDRAFVEEQTTRLGLPFRAVRVDPRAEAEREGISLQMAARRLRYAWFNTLLQEGPATLALGHHRDDAVETLFIQLLRGTGIHGWAGIPPVSRVAEGAGAFIRPLLGVDRSAILAYAREHRIPFREDASNADPKYLRNRIRLELLPLLEELRPGATKTIGRSLDRLRELTIAADLHAHQVLRGQTVEGALPFTALEGSATPRLLLLTWLGDTSIHPDVIDQVLAAMEDRHTGATFIVGEQQLTVDRNALLIHPITDGFPSFLLSDGEVPGSAGPFTWACPEGSKVDTSEGRDTAWLDVDRLQFPLMLRPWQRGDRMRPAGLHGSKAISDLLIDAKVPMALKPAVYVLVSGDVIVWLVGHRVAEGYQATPQTRRVLCLRHA